MEMMTVLHASLFVVFLPAAYCNIRWMALEHYPLNSKLDPELMCDKKYGLTYKQIKFCQTKFHWMRLIHDASSDTVGECQEQLGERRWNCLSILKAPTFDSDLKKQTREGAFVYALSAVALALQVANGCMAGTVPECSCRHPKRHVSFSSEIIDKDDMSNIDGLLGCKGIMKYGQDFARNFVELGYRRKARNDRQRQEIAVNRHSVEVGLKELTDGEEISCRCNGVTAGCAFQFCHRRIVPLKNVAKKLLEKYDNAVKVGEKAIVETIVSNAPSPNKVFVVSNAYKNKLLFLSEGPNHCGFQNGYQAISRRQCVIDASKTNNCAKLCCRGYQERIIEVHSQCRCKFVYCCKVVCDTCKSFKKIYECL